MSKPKSKLSKLERIKFNRERKKKNALTLQGCKDKLASFCGIGGNYSALELVIAASVKFDYIVRGDIHPHQQIKALCRMIDKSDGSKRVIVNRCKTMKDFYSSRAWKILRYQAFEKYKNKCCCCGATPEDGLSMHVDHILPRSTHPQSALDLNNLQILCEDCNVGKINQWDTDWRP